MAKCEDIMLYPYVMSTCHFVCYKLLLFPAARSLDALPVASNARGAEPFGFMCPLC